eukprot:269072_1
MLTDDDTTPFFPPDDDHIHHTSTTDVDKSQSNKLQSIASRANAPLLYFIVSTILSLCVALLAALQSPSSHDFAYITSGIIGISICAFAIKHFRALIDLSTSVDHFYQLNRTLRKEHRCIQSNIDRLSAAQNTLNETHNRLSDANKRNKENLVHFRHLQGNLDQFNTTCAEDLQHAMNKANHIEDMWHKELYQHQRALLHHLFDQFSSCQHDIGMTKDEFIEFSHHLPVEYQDRFRRMGTFEVLSCGKAYILLEDFEKTLDIFAEMQANDCEIEFYMKQTDKKRKVNPKQALRTRERECDDDLITYESQVVITRRSNPGESLQDARGISCATEDRYTYQTSHRGLHRTATRFDDEWITDLSTLHALPDIDFMKT